MAVSEARLTWRVLTTLNQTQEKAAPGRLCSSEGREAHECLSQLLSSSQWWLMALPTTVTDWCCMV